MSDENSFSTDPIDPLTVGELISMSEASKQSGFDANFLRDLANKGRLKARRTGNTWLTTMVAIEEYKKTRHRGKRTDLDKSMKTL